MKKKKTNKQKNCHRKRYNTYIGTMTSKIYWGIIKEEKKKQSKIKYKVKINSKYM